MATKAKKIIGSALKQTPTEASVIHLAIEIDRKFPKETKITGSSFEGSFNNPVKLTKHTAFFTLNFKSEALSRFHPSAVVVSSTRADYENAKSEGFKDTLRVGIKVIGIRRSGTATFSS